MQNIHLRLPCHFVCELVSSLRVIPTGVMEWYGKCDPVSTTGPRVLRPPECYGPSSRTEFHVCSVR